MLVSQLLKKHRDCVEESEVGTVGESIRLSSIWPGFDFLTYRPMWTEFVGSLFCSKVFFPGAPGFPSHRRQIFDFICSLNS